MPSDSEPKLKFWRQKYFYLLAAAFLGIYGLLFYTNQQNAILIEVEFEANQPGLMTFYWPIRRSKYEPSRSQSLPYPAGASRLVFDAPDMTRDQVLRFDPDAKKNRLLLQRIRITKRGKVTVLEADDIRDRVSSTVGLRWSAGPAAIELILESEDPILYLQDLPLPAKTIFHWLLPLLTLFLLVPLANWLTRPGTHALKRFTTLAIIILLFLYWSDKLIHQNLLMTVFISVTAAFAVIAVIRLLEVDWPTESYPRFYQALLFSGLFTALVVGEMILTLDTATLEKMQTTAMDSFRENREQGLNRALKISSEALETSFSENFHARKELLTINAESKIFAFGFSPTSKAIIGRDNWFFEGYGGRRVEEDIVRPFDNITDYMGQSPFTEEQLEAWRIALEERYYWLRERGTDYIFALAPTKALVYPEKLPDRILEMKTRLNRPTRYDQLIDYLEKNSVVPVVDLRKALVTAKANASDMSLFYRTDFHWNYYGAFLAYNAIIRAINDAYPKYDLRAANLDEFTIKKQTDWAHERFMAMVGLNPARHKNDIYYTFFPRPGSPYASISNFAETGISDDSLPESLVKEYGNEQFRVREIDNPGGELSLMLVIGDSFIEKTLAYFSLHTKKLLNFRAVTNFPVSPYTIGNLNPDIVVQEILNMYLLQSPPTNPPGVRAARTRALERADKNQENE